MLSQSRRKWKKRGERSAIAFLTRNLGGGITRRLIEGYGVLAAANAARINSARLRH